MTIWPFHKPAAPSRESLDALRAGDEAIHHARQLDARVDRTVAASRAVLERNHVAASLVAAIQGETL